MHVNPKSSSRPRLGLKHAIMDCYPILYLLSTLRRGFSVLIHRTEDIRNFKWILTKGFEKKRVKIVESA